MTESWTEAQIRMAFKGARRIPVYPGNGATAEAHTAGSLMYQLRLQRQREQECIRWTGPWPDADVADFLARDRAQRAAATHPYQGPTYDGNGMVDICGSRGDDDGWCLKPEDHPIHQATPEPAEHAQHEFEDVGHDFCGRDGCDATWTAPVHDVAANRPIHPDSWCHPRGDVVNEPRYTERAIWTAVEQCMHGQHYEKRARIADDVLAALAAGEPQPADGWYCDSNDDVCGPDVPCPRCQREMESEVHQATPEEPS